MMTPEAEYALAINDLGMTFKRNSPFQNLLKNLFTLMRLKQSLISLSFMFDENNGTIIFFLRDALPKLKILSFIAWLHATI